MCLPSAFTGVIFVEMCSKLSGSRRFRSIYSLNCLCNLHSAWDSKIIQGQELSYSEKAEWLGDRLSDAQVQEWMEPNPLVWINESAKIRDGIYPEKPSISYSYA